MTRAPLLLMLLASCAPARLLFEDDFANLDHWSVEGSGTAVAEGGTLTWDCGGTREGTAWCKRRFEGPTLVTYDVQVLGGRDNINFFAYADVLLEAKRTGAYGEYHVFANYLITYLLEDSLWRVRFRKNPGFALLSETRMEGPEPDRWRSVAYAFERDGTIRLSVDGRLLQEFRDPRPLELSGLHGLRTWRTRLRYRGFKVYALP